MKAKFLLGVGALTIATVVGLSMPASAQVVHLACHGDVFSTDDTLRAGGLVEHNERQRAEDLSITLDYTARQIVWLSRSRCHSEVTAMRHTFSVTVPLTWGMA